MALKFGTSGIRGLVTELTDREVYLFTTAFLKHAESVGQSLPVAIAEDLRESSPQIQKAVCRAISDFGQQIFLCGKIPTPALAFFAQEKKILAIMITGSHIPADRNGIKFYLQTGETLKTDDQHIYEIYSGLKQQSYKKELFSDSESFLQELATAPSIQDVSTEAVEVFTKRYLDFFSEKALLGAKIIVYQHSSVARDILPSILEKLGAQIIRLGKTQTFTPVDTEAVESTQVFQEWIREHKADALVSTDGDGDRPLIVDDQGTVIPGDKVGILTSLFLGIQAIAMPISCNSCAVQMKEFKKVSITKIGSPYVVEALNILSGQYPLVAGFEANGGYILESSVDLSASRKLHKLPTRDSVLPILCVLIAARERKTTLSLLLRSLPPRYTCSVLLKNCPTVKSQNILLMAGRDPAGFLKKMSSEWETEVVDMNELDGVRLTLKNNDILHFRPSGNAPEFRCYVESNTQEKADRLAQIAKKSLQELLAQL
ncbi:MAG: phosphomannomutase [Bacillota bacterium]